MSEYSKLCVETFLKNQGQLFDEKVAENYEVAAAYLEDFATARTRFLDVNLGRVQVQGKVKDQLPAGLRNFLVRVNNLFEAFIVNFKLINK